MRINKTEINAIKHSFDKTFKTGSVFLFGSRVDDNIKGGDIDLYIVTDNRKHLNKKKIDFLVDLKHKIGDQKIDIVVAKDATRPIEQEALKHGILL
ncbi:MAG: nucleotidyltransferase domain-containing protein [Methylococcales symbiont of Hymedesmia sp. n. MRB-2018]|nr:MAG: nucleotidyltransferase domain-containing protein [Methylococcales symbiont of Hymedesmia sp. n. MRB-2018]KAF3982725.1 MAG: nucleotidyltransferase domain-containing protein [Methylococcales symbiont of Hymedesmia sp. n. MRB-2018]